MKMWRAKAGRALWLGLSVLFVLAFSSRAETPAGATPRNIWEYGLVQNEKVGARTLDLLEKYKDQPFFFFVHFAEVDHSGHQHGENSAEYNAALISSDEWTGRIVKKLKDLGLYDKTLIYVTADHGFDEGGKSHCSADLA